MVVPAYIFFVSISIHIVEIKTETLCWNMYAIILLWNNVLVSDLELVCSHYIYCVQGTQQISG
jgi:hypothetical protein